MTPNNGYNIVLILAVGLAPFFSDASDIRENNFCKGKKIALISARLKPLPSSEKLFFLSLTSANTPF